MAWTQGRGVALFRKATITNKALTSNVATLTTSVAHGYAVGESVNVAGVDATFNGTYVITAVTSTTFNYAKTAANVTSAAATGTAAIDHSTELPECVFEFSKDLLTIPATLGSDEDDYEGGAVERNLTLGFFTAFSATSFHEALRTVAEATGEVTFDVLLEGLVVGTSNPRRTGTIIVNSLTTGGEVGSLRTQTQTYRIKPGTYLKASV